MISLLDSETRSNRSNRSDCSKTANFVPERYHSSPDQVLEQKSERSDSEYNEAGLNLKARSVVSISQPQLLER